jgi:hypothetical protein
MLNLRFDIPDYASSMGGSLAFGPGAGVRRQIVLSLANAHAKAVEDEVKKNAPTESGRLRASIRTHLINKRLGVLEAWAPYARYLHEGTGIYGPKRKPIEIKPKEKKALNWKGAGHPVKRARQRGIKPSDFLRMSLAQSRAERRVRQIMQSIVAKHEAKARAAANENSSWHDYWNWGEFFEDLAQRSGNFASGFGDTISFGITGAIRQMMNTDRYVNESSDYYKLGEYSELAFEIIATGGSTLLRYLAKNASRKAAYASFRNMTKNIPRNGKYLHHKNPLFGHPIQITSEAALFPTGGLPASLHSHRWNLKLLTYENHLRAHRRLYRLERLGKYTVNPKITSLRAIKVHLPDEPEY